MLFHLGNKCLQCLHQYWQFGVVFHPAEKHFMGENPDFFQKGDKDILPQISRNVQSSDIQSDKDFHGSCFNIFGNIRIVISKWTTRDYPVMLVVATHCFKCLNPLTPNGL
jgi:hypothetical protein